MFKFALVAGASAMKLNGNTTANATHSTLPYGQTDYGVKAGESQHASTMAWANEKWAAQQAGVNGQASDDKWRNNGPKAAWGQAPDPQPPKIAFAQKNVTGNATYSGDYGVAAGVEEHAITMGKAQEREDIRVKKIKAQEQANAAKNGFAQLNDPHCSWVSHLNTTTDYGVAVGSTYHTETMTWNEMKEKERQAAIKAQADSDVWRKSDPGPYAPFPNCNAEVENPSKVGNVPAPKSPERPDLAPQAPTAAKK